MRTHGSKGFTLVELAVVLVIVGVLVTVVLIGRQLMDGARIRAIITEQEKYQPAIKAFLEKYREFPGDLSDAQSYWGSAVNGDGDEMVEWSTDESVQAWYQLEQANILTQGGMSGTATSHTAVVGTNVPRSALADNAGWYMDYTAGFGNHFGLGAQDTSGINDVAALSGIIAKDIDKKLDDSKANTGRVRGASGADCHSSGAYTLSGSSAGVAACTMQFLFVTE